MSKLKFGKGNAKLKKHIHTFSLPAGYCCPGANRCLSKVVIRNGQRKIKDGPHTEFRCFSASQEALYPATYEARQHNFALLKGLGLRAMIDLITLSLPRSLAYLRNHVSGDFLINVTLMLG